MIKLGLIAGLVVLAAASQAVVFSVVSVGTFTLGGGGYTTSESVVAQTTPSILASMFFDATYAGVGANGTITYTGANGTVDLAFTAPGPFIFAGNTSSLNGSWTFTSGTGDYAGYVGGTGTFAAVYHVTDSYSSTTLTGDLEPVPEPATMAILGVGALTLIRRRRR